MLDRRRADNDLGFKIYDTGKRGYGLLSCRDFKPGEPIVEYTGEIITHEELRHRRSNVYKVNSNLRDRLNHSSDLY